MSRIIAQACIVVVLLVGCTGTQVGPLTGPVARVADLSGSWQESSETGGPSLYLEAGLSFRAFNIPRAVLGIAPGDPVSGEGRWGLTEFAGEQRLILRWQSSTAAQVRDEVELRHEASEWRLRLMDPVSGDVLVLRRTTAEVPP